jgi:hypothetical protein
MFLFSNLRGDHPASYFSHPSLCTFSAAIMDFHPAERTLGMGEKLGFFVLYLFTKKVYQT